MEPATTTTTTTAAAATTTVTATGTWPCPYGSNHVFLLCFGAKTGPCSRSISGT